MCLSDSNNANAFLDELVKENSFYFNSIDTIEKFIDINFLDSYTDKNTSQIKELFDVNFYLWKNNPGEYIRFARNYINISCNIIDERGEKIYRKLKTFFEQ